MTKNLVWCTFIVLFAKNTLFFTLLVKSRTSRTKNDEKSEEKVISFTDITLNRVLQFREKWAAFVGAPGDVGRRSLADFPDLKQSTADVGFHKTCYNRLTDKKR